MSNIVTMASNFQPPLSPFSTTSIRWIVVAVIDTPAATIAERAY